MSTATFTLRSFQRTLEGLRNEWENGNPMRHAQATGLLLGQIAERRYSASSYIAEIMGFMQRNGPQGIDGVFLSILSASQVENVPAFDLALSMCGVIENSLDKSDKEGFGIFFADLREGAAARTAFLGFRDRTAGCSHPRTAC